MIISIITIINNIKVINNSAAVPVPGGEACRNERMSCCCGSVNGDHNNNKKKKKNDNNSSTHNSTNHSNDNVARGHACGIWLRRSAVSTNGAAATVMSFDRLGKKVHPGSCG